MVSAAEQRCEHHSTFGKAKELQVAWFTPSRWSFIAWQHIPISASIRSSMLPLMAASGILMELFSAASSGWRSSRWRMPQIAA